MRFCCTVHTLLFSWLHYGKALFDSLTARRQINCAAKSWIYKLFDQIDHVLLRQHCTCSFSYLIFSIQSSVVVRGYDKTMCSVTDVFAAQSIFVKYRLLLVEPVSATKTIRDTITVRRKIHFDAPNSEARFNGSRCCNSTVASNWSFLVSMSHGIKYLINIYIILIVARVGVGSISIQLEMIKFNVSLFIRFT